jgi:hypothetical protein
MPAELRTDREVRTAGRRVRDVPEWEECRGLPESAWMDEHELDGRGGHV